MERIVISLGGSVFTRDNYKYAKDYVDIINLMSNDYEIYVVVGGGNPARFFIDIGKQYGLKSHQLDWLGINVTRINSLLFAYLLGYDQYNVPSNVDELLLKKDTIKVMGGVKPNQSTDAVAAEIAVRVNASYLLNLTDVMGVYDKDPKKYKDAKFLNRLCYGELYSLFKEYSQKPGDYPLFDLKGIYILKDSDVILKIIDATLPSNILNFKHVGTEVRRC